jgi:REP element-mobilizing transposase RayT
LPAGPPLKGLFFVVGGTMEVLKDVQSNVSENVREVVEYYIESIGHISEETVKRYIEDQKSV